MAKIVSEYSNTIQITVVEEIKCYFDEDLKIMRTVSTVSRAINDE